MSDQPAVNRGVTPQAILVWIVLAAVATWAVWRPSVIEMFHKWWVDPTYSHGYLVPFFSLGLLWFWRDKWMTVEWKPSWWGVLLIALGVGIQFLGSFMFWRWFQGAALLVYLAGITLVLGGWRPLRIVWPAIGFLVFMIPMPYRIEEAMRAPLQRFATMASTFLLQLIGMPALSEGNVILINEHELGVAEACSGLKMLITFFALATGFVLLVKRPYLDKAIILLSAVPIAVISNVIRITVTGILYVTVGEKTAEFVYHDLAGYLMMPLGIALMWLEMVILDHLFVERKEQDPRDLRPFVLGQELGVPGAPGVRRP